MKLRLDSRYLESRATLRQFGYGVGWLRDQGYLQIELFRARLFLRPKPLPAKPF